MDEEKLRPVGVPQPPKAIRLTSRTTNPSWGESSRVRLRVVEILCGPEAVEKLSYPRGLGERTAPRFENGSQDSRKYSREGTTPPDAE